MENIDNLDKKILHILYKNARTPNTTIAKRVNKSKDTVKYRINKLTTSGTIEQFYLDIHHKNMGFNLYIIFFRFRKIKEDRLDKILNSIVKTPNVTYVSTCFGNWDLWVELLVENIDKFDDVLKDLIKKIGPTLQDYKTLISTEEYKKYKPIIGSFTERIKKPEKTFKFKRTQVDIIDYSLLKILENNSRIPLIEISRKLGLSVDIVRYRLRKLEENIIQGYSIVLNPYKMGYNLNTIIINLQNLTLEREKILKKYIKTQPNIRFATKTTGKQEIIIEILTKDIEELQKVINGIRNKFSDVVLNYDNITIFKEYKDNTVPYILI